mmetsp:Transcript_45363/g.108211  ORF Transcript_45363/g.108211 Transcript_45363/m.108211 type:complete len:278 (-) Transcript_45363:3238-4071(-)
MVGVRDLRVAHAAACHRQGHTDWCHGPPAVAQGRHLGKHGQGADRVVEPPEGEEPGQPLAVPGVLGRVPRDVHPDCLLEVHQRHGGVRGPAAAAVADRVHRERREARRRGAVGGRRGAHRPGDLHRQDGGVVCAGDVLPPGLPHRRAPPQRVSHDHLPQVVPAVLQGSPVVQGGRDGVADVSGLEPPVQRRAVPPSLLEHPPSACRWDSAALQPPRGVGLRGPRHHDCDDSAEHVDREEAGPVQPRDHEGQGRAVQRDGRDPAGHPDHQVFRVGALL